MTETAPAYSERIQEEVDTIHFLSGLVERPGAFLAAQNELLYRQGTERFATIGSLGERGLPADTDAFYRRPEVELPHITNVLPRVLNVGSGAEASRKMPAINVDVSADGEPDIVAPADRLPFADGTFSVLRASHVLEHIPQDQLLAALKEWRRVLHKDGVLHVAVPDAAITFQEIIDGTTPKGTPSLSFEESTAPLAQIYGLGYTDPQTDPRWNHTIIFSQALLERFLRAAGFTHIERRNAHEDLAHHVGIDDDSQNHYSLLVSAGQEKLPHSVDQPLPYAVFRQQCHTFTERHPEAQPVSFIIPVCNEARHLPHFLAFLENATNLIGAKREFIFVVNGCTDNSETIIRQYLGHSDLQGSIVHSPKGIVEAMATGLAHRTRHGFVGKLDADTVLHPHCLDLMHMFLTDNGEVEATYAEPAPLDSESAFNEAEHKPIMRSKRLYLHGRASLYRDVPGKGLIEGSIPDGLKAEDIFLSFYYTYFYGLDAVARAPHALVYGKTVTTFDDLVKQNARSATEIERVCTFYPPFRILAKLLEREVYPSRYRVMNEQSKHNAPQGVTEWTRLGSTK